MITAVQSSAFSSCYLVVIVISKDVVQVSWLVNTKFEYNQATTMRISLSFHIAGLASTGTRCNNNDSHWDLFLRISRVLKRNGYCSLATFMILVLMQRIQYLVLCCTQLIGAWEQVHVPEYSSAGPCCAILVNKRAYCRNTAGTWQTCLSSSLLGDSTPCLWAYPSCPFGMEGWVRWVLDS